MQSNLYKILYNATAADGIGSAMLVKYHRHITLQISASGISGESCIVKAQISNSEAMPDFSAAATPDNSWDYVVINDLQSGDDIVGDTGATIDANGVREFELQTNAAKWINIEISSTSGTFTLKVEANADNN